MRIAIVAPITHKLPTTGYAPWEKVVENLATGLSKQGHEVDVYAAADSTPHTSYNIVPTVDKSIANIDKFQFAQELIHVTTAAKLIANKNYDIVHNHCNWYGALALETIGRDYLMTSHGYEPEGAFVLPQLKHAKIISISKSEQKKIAIDYWDVVYNGIDFEQFKLVEKKSDYYITAARICFNKGIHNSIRLAKETNTRLYLAGMITELDYFETKIKPHIDDSQIIYLGNIPQEELRNYIANARAYISLLEWDEPFGLSVAEAIASGTPVIANRFGSMPELVSEGVSGILVNNVDEAVKRQSEVSAINPEACRAYGEEKFSIQAMTKGYLNAYNRLIATKPSLQ